MDLNPPVKLSVINSLIKAKLVGDADYELRGINEIHIVRDGDLTFVDHPKYYDKALKSAATVIKINIANFFFSKNRRRNSDSTRSFRRQSRGDRKKLFDTCECFHR